MNAWSNISVSVHDSEIQKINEFKAKLGKLPDSVYKIRELITRHEVCHFKYLQHINKIKTSILNLELVLAPESIGINHIQHGENAWKNDSTGKSLLGQQYVWAIKYWLGEFDSTKIPDNYDKKHGQRVQKWLGNNSADKMRLVRLLLSRLTWDWKIYEELQHGGNYKELEWQISRMDICHYAFPSNLDRVLKGIGEMNPIENFEGCGSFNTAIREQAKQELKILNDLFQSFCSGNKFDKSIKIKAWLTACLIKTLKEQVELNIPIINF